MGHPKTATPTGTHPAEFAEAVTPSNTADLDSVPRALYVGTGGDLSVNMPDGATITFKNYPSGAFFPVRVARVNATGTTATDIVALY